MKKRALISVSNKTGIIPFVKGLLGQGVEVISTGETKQFLQSNQLSVLDLPEGIWLPVVGETIQPGLYTGVIADCNNNVQIEEQSAIRLDYIIVNLATTQEILTKNTGSFTQLVENVDIDRSTLIRFATKNSGQVAVIVDPSDYEMVLAEMKKHQDILPAQKQALAAKAFRHLAASDAAIAECLTNYVKEESPETLTVTYEKKQQLQSGENPHQKATLYQQVRPTASSVAFAEQLHGKELSYNNIVDADTAVQMIQEFDEPAVAVVKHMNPCGVGIGKTISEAYARAYEADPISIFGSVVVANREINCATAEKMQELFLEVIIAPSFSEEALGVLKSKKNVRLLSVDITKKKYPSNELSSIEGGLLVQEQDLLRLEDVSVTIPTKQQPSEEDWRNLKLAWKVAKHMKSNAAVITKDQMTLSVGAGHLNKVGATIMAIRKAGAGTHGAALASDAFLSMSDAVEAAAEAGITAIIQPGGSMRDPESIATADEHGIAMVITGVRHFKH